MKSLTRFIRRWTIRIFLAGLLLTTVSCWYLIRQNRQTLHDLTHPGERRAITEVFSRWLEISPRHQESTPYILRWLQGLQYIPVKAQPERPGEYWAEGSEIVVYTREFIYPDRTEPATLLHLTFSDGRLASIQLPMQNNDYVGGWRLEPWRLAQWASSPNQLRERVTLETLPAYVPAAILAMEDKRFFEHGALDGVGLARALWADIRHQGFRQGGSTITQQLSRSVFLSNERTVRRKVLETLLAFYLEQRYSKDQLLEMYLNQVYWGQDNGQPLIGIEAASQSYFGKPAARLSVGESALLAGLLQSPNRYSPRRSLETSRKRRDTVLGLMHSQGIITEAQLRRSKAEKIAVSAGSGKENEAAYFLASLQDDLEDRYTLPVLLSAGWRIFTTLDPVVQHMAVGSLRPRMGEAALVAIESQTGAVRAWVGGTGFLKSPYDRVINAHRQPGSAFKPFVVLAAIDSRAATPATLLPDTPLSVPFGKATWTPKNYDHRYRGNVLLWDALTQSLNVPIVRLGASVGLSKVTEYARLCGITSPMREVPSLPLGTSEVTVLELTGAYATLANDGIANEPYRTQIIVDQDGKTVESHEAKPHQAVPAESAILVGAMLRAVLDEGTARSARALGFTAPAAGKTGTSENYQDAWFIGYTPDLVAGVWVGYDIPKTLGSSAAGIALPLWTGFMRQAQELTIGRPFNDRELRFENVDPETGSLARSGCPQRRRLPFLKTSVPPLCTKHAGGIKGFFKRLFS